MSAKKALVAVLLGCGVVACGVASEDAESGDNALNTSADKFIDRDDARAHEFIVVHNASLADSARDALVARYNAQVFHTYDVVLSGFAARMSDADARALAQEPSVKYVARNGIKHTSATQSNATWGIDRVDQVSMPLDKKYNYTLTGKGVNAVVIDTGVDAKHPDFEGRVAKGFNALSTGSPDDSADVHGHGSHVGGTMGSKTWGLAKETTIVPVRVCNAQGECSDADIIKAVDWVTANVAKPAVVNMSLGGPADNTVQPLEDAIKKSIASGITYVVAAGNDNKDACNYSPARVPEAITVGATGQSFIGAGDGRASFSNFGRCVDIFAPGAGITSVKRNSTGSTNMDGTSMASPHGAGVVALLLQKDPTATPAQIAETLRATAVPGKVTNPGAGSPNFLLHIGE